MIRILHLYPEELGINGDVGNVIALAQRARWRGIDVEIVNRAAGEPLPDAVDIVHVGSGPVSAQLAVHDDLLTIAPRLREWAAAGVPMLAIAGGFQLLGRTLAFPDGRVLDGAGVFPVAISLVAERRVGELVVESDFGTLAGFENHASRVTRLDDSRPLGIAVAAEVGPVPRPLGVAVGGLIGTNLHGAFLPLNPAVADHLLRLATGAELPPALDDRLAIADERAANAREAIAARLR